MLKFAVFNIGVQRRRNQRWNEWHRYSENLRSPISASSLTIRVLAELIPMILYTNDVLARIELNTLI